MGLRVCGILHVWTDAPVGGCEQAAGYLAMTVSPWPPGGSCLEACAWLSCTHKSNSAERGVRVGPERDLQLFACTEMRVPESLAEFSPLPVTFLPPLYHPPHPHPDVLQYRHNPLSRYCVMKKELNPHYAFTILCVLHLGREGNHGLGFSSTITCKLTSPPNPALMSPTPDSDFLGVLPRGRGHPQGKYKEGILCQLPPPF